MNPSYYILGSRSPRRLELLKLLVPGERITVKPPRSPEEAGFAGLTDPGGISRRLQEIVMQKMTDVNGQLSAEERRHSMGIVADTIVVAAESNRTSVVLGQPPDVEGTATVRDWFTRYYSGRTHEVWTGVCLWNAEGIVLFEIVKTAVTFRPIAPPEIEWYLATGESAGKAGGYGLQGLASVFVSQVEGSLSNVIGLPLETVRKAIAHG